MPLVTRWFMGMCVAAVVMSMFGCPPKPTDIESQTWQPAPQDYASFRADYNAHVGGITQFWSRAEVQADWTNAQGEPRQEAGDGPLIYRRPKDFALALGRLGHPYLWVGCNATTAWILNLSDPRTAYVLPLHQPGAIQLRDAGMLPLRPDEFPFAMGLAELPDPETLRRHRLEISDNFLRLTWVTRVQPLRQFTYWFDHELGQLARIELHRLDPETKQFVTNPEDRIMLVELDRYTSIKDHPPLDVSPTDFPRWHDPQSDPPDRVRPMLPRRITMHFQAMDSSLKISLSQIQHGSSKVRDMQFDLTQLIASLNIEQIQHITTQHPRKTPRKHPENFHDVP